jgi:hypothetical protein
VRSKLPLYPTEYPGRFSDHSGDDPASVENDGARLLLSVRGVSFVSTDAVTWRPAEAALSYEQASRFDWRSGHLVNCAVRWKMPLPVLCDGRKRMAELNVAVHVPPGEALPGSDWADLRLALVYGGLTYASRGGSGDFENEMLDLQRQLPDGTSIYACITCQWSDYSPTGHSPFGDMVCYRRCKCAYAAARGKRPFLNESLWVDRGAIPRTQETHRCRDWRLREPGTGYRG